MDHAARDSVEFFGAIVAGVILYVLITFALTYARMPKRGLHHTFVYALRETMLAVFITLLMPFYVAIGHKRGRGHRPVVLVHGYTQNRVNFLYLSRFLRARGFGPVYGFNYFSFGDIRGSGKRLARFVERVCRETGAKSVDLVCHSMGGLVARECVRLEQLRAEATGDPGAGRVRRCVTIASPHSGVAFHGPVLGPGGRQLIAGAKFLTELNTTPLGVPTLSIFSRHDNVVGDAAASLASFGGQDFIVDHVAHLTILFDKRVATAVAEFLLQPEIATPQSGHSASESVDSGTVTAPPLA